MLEDFEGLALVTRRKPNRKTRMVKRRKGKLFRDEADAETLNSAPWKDKGLGERRREETGNDGKNE